MSIRQRQARVQAYLDLVSRHDGGAESVPEVVALPETESVGGTEGPPAAAIETANAGLAKLKAGRADDTTPDELLSVEAIIFPDIRPALDVVDGDFRCDHPSWPQLDGDAAIHARLLAALPHIGRIELPGQTTYPYAGTGFLVGPGLLMTNRHVAQIFASGLGDRQLAFRPGWQAAVDLKRERDRDAQELLAVRGIAMIHPYWDMALLRVEGPAATGHLRLSLADVADLDGREIAVIGYPAFDPLRNDIGVQNRLFDKAYGVKRLQPGRLAGRRQVESFGKLVSAATHDCSTLGGNSGSALVDLATGEVLGLHFGGRYLDINHGVPAFELARDGRIVDAGVAFAGSAGVTVAGSAGGGTPPWQDWWQRATPGEAPAPLVVEAGSTAAAVATTTIAGEISVTVPLHLTIRLGDASVPVPVKPGALKLVEPVHDSDYAGRTGYDPAFLGPVVPMPTAIDSGLLAPTKAGGDTLAYQNFSIRMHAARRIALVVAWNLTAEKALKAPEAGRDYSRTGLTGLGANEIEKWFPDPRLDAKFLLSDAFYSNDAGAFDKGHVARREDVAWGSSYALVRRGNGDSFHVTNCSPQIAGFNQATRGVDNWGDLEDLVLGQAASERLNVFAGPILAADDESFVGTDAAGAPARVKIPRSFWKVVVARTADGIAAWGFILDQDLSKVPLEFTVSPAFRRKLVPLATISARAGIVFADAVKAADQFGLGGGQELAFRAGIERDADAGESLELPTPNGGDDAAAEGEADRVLAPTEALIDWRVAGALLALRSQVNARFPNRSKAADGTIGDAAHASRSSDHNPWVMDGRKGVVTALDITHDPAGGCDAHGLAETLRSNRDPRIKYLISQRRIASSSIVGGVPAWTWRPYGGSNGHNHHAHVSVKSEKTLYDDERPWAI